VARECVSTVRRGRKTLEFSIVTAHLFHGLFRIFRRKTPYDVEVTGGGRGSAINHRLSGELAISSIAECEKRVQSDIMFHDALRRAGLREG
jgi:hypothetical protein